MDDTPTSRSWRGVRVCVTGGSGFLGLHLVRQLLDGGARVRVLSLPIPRSHPLHQLAPVEQINGDIRDRAVVRRALAGCRIIFHTAGVVGVWGPALANMWSVHVEGTRNVLETAPANARIVHTSSIMAIAASRSPEAKTENCAFDPAGVKLPYCLAKRTSEELALEMAARRDVVVTNPGFLVGPMDFEPSVVGRMCLRFWKGRMPLIPPGGLNLVDVRDVAWGHLLAAERGQRGQRYILGGENRTYLEFLKALAEVAGFHPRAQPRLPLWLMAAVAGLAECRAWLTGREPFPALAHVHLARFSWFFRSEKAAVQLGWHGRPLRASLEDTYRWFRSRSGLNMRGLNRWWMRPRQAA